MTGCELPRNGQRNSASLARRLAAMVYDLFLLCALAILLTALAVAIEAARVGPMLIHASGQAALQETGQIILQGLLLGMVGCFFIGFWRTGGQTPGMRSWQIRVVSIHGGPLSIRQCLLRLLLAVPALAAGGVGYWWALLDPQGRSWPDLASGSMILPAALPALDPPQEPDTRQTQQQDR